MNFVENIVKYTAFYRCIDDINNLRIRVRFKNTESVDYEEVVLSWQEKRFSNFEKEFYKHPDNCVGEYRKIYLKELSEMTGGDVNDNVIFSYTDTDSFVCNENCISNGDDNHEFDNNCERMHILADLGTYVDGAWVKNEHVLCSIKYDKERGLFSIYPDFSQKNPYFFQTHDDITRNFIYYIEDFSEKLSEEAMVKEEELLYKVALQHKIPKKTFEMPPKDKLRVHLLFEISWARNFEHDDIRVQYFVYLPKYWSCQNPHLLQGVTQNCRPRNNSEVVHFGHTFDLILDYDLKHPEEKGFTTNPYVYFEVVSKDAWRRFRTEGLAYLGIPLSRPNVYEFDLQCCRFRPKGFKGDLRRFFIGDCSNYDDITWLGIPKDHENNILCKFGVNTVGTGRVGIKLYVVHQSETFITNNRVANDVFIEREKFLYEKLASKTFYKSVEEVLEAFTKVRNNMNVAKKQV